MAGVKKVSVTVALNNQLSKGASKAASDLLRAAQRAADQEAKIKALARVREEKAQAKEVAQKESFSRRLAQKEAQMQFRAIAQREKALSAARLREEKASIASAQRIAREQERAQAKAARAAESRRRQRLQDASNLAVAGDSLGRLAGRGVAFGKNAFNTFKSFEEAINDARLKKGLSATDAGFLRLRDKAREVGATTQFTATEAAQAFEKMSAAGLSVEKQIEIIGDVANIAAIEGISLGEAYDAAATAISGFGDKAGTFKQATDVISAASDASRASITSISEALAGQGKAIESYGVSYKDAVSLIAALSESGLMGGEAGTAVRNFSTNIGAVQSKRGIAALKRIGLTQKDIDLSDVGGFLEKLSERMDARFGKGDNAGSIAERGKFLKSIFDVRGATDVAAILGVVQSGTFGKVRAEVERTNVAQEKAAERAKTTAASVRELESAFEELQISMIEGLAPTIKGIIDMLTGITTKIGNFAKENPGIAKGVGLGAAGLVGAAAVGGLSARVFSGLKVFGGAASSAARFLGFGGQAAAAGSTAPVAASLGAKAGGGLLRRAMPVLGAGISAVSEYASSGSLGRASSAGGGALAGSLAGAKGGAMLGSFLGPLGTAAGTLIGGIAGGILGEKLGVGLHDSVTGAPSQVASQPIADTQAAPVRGTVDLNIKVDSDGVAKVTNVSLSEFGNIFRLNTGGALPTV